jgi:hypothetical protein
MPDKTPKEVAATVMSQRAKSSRIAGQTSPGPKGPNKAKDPKSPSFNIVESTTRPSCTADNASTSSVRVSEHNTKSPAREQDNATLPSQSEKDAVEERSADGNESTPPRARAVKGVVM